MIPTARASKRAPRARRRRYGPDFPPWAHARLTRTPRMSDEKVDRARRRVLGALTASAGALTASAGAVAAVASHGAVAPARGETPPPAEPAWGGASLRDMLGSMFQHHYQQMSRDEIQAALQ